MMKDFQNYVNWLSEAGGFQNEDQLLALISKLRGLMSRTQNLPASYSQAYYNIRNYHYDDEGNYVDDTDAKAASSADSIIANYKNDLTDWENEKDSISLGSELPTRPNLMEDYEFNAFFFHFKFNLSARSLIVSFTEDINHLIEGITPVGTDLTTYKKFGVYMFYIPIGVLAVDISASYISDQLTIKFGAYESPFSFLCPAIDAKMVKSGSINIHSTNSNATHIVTQEDLDSLDISANVTLNATSGAPRVNLAPNNVPVNFFIGANQRFAFNASSISIANKFPDGKNLSKGVDITKYDQEPADIAQEIISLYPNFSDAVSHLPSLD